MAEEIERLGESRVGPGYLLLGLLSEQGWFVAVTRGFADGVLVIVDHPRYGRVEKQGASVAALACDLVEECSVLSAHGGAC